MEIEEIRRKFRKRIRMALFKKSCKYFGRSIKALLKFFFGPKISKIIWKNESYLE